MQQNNSKQPVSLLFNFFCAFFVIGSLQIKANEKTAFVYQNKSSLVKFAVDEIKQVLSKQAGFSFDLDILSISTLQNKQTNYIFLSLEDEQQAKFITKAKIARTSELSKEGFLIYKASKNSKTIWVVGYDEAGLMYGGLEIAEILKVQGFLAIQNQLQNPYMKVRGTKFNIPLDMRSPTYTEPSTAAQNSIKDVWDFDFWKDYIDNIARFRYNLISLWNMHPFPSMVKVPEYPTVALDEVHKSAGIWKENYSLNGWGFDAPEIMKSYEVVKTMTIDDKINFWRKVMAYGKARNVKFYMVTWNVFDYGIDGKYGITDKVENPITRDYFRKSVKQMVLTYPDLAGIGLTTGENMYDYSANQKEEWAYATYGLGVLDVLKEQPNRKIDFIHRQHQSKASEITKIFKSINENKNVNFIFSFKYAQAHVYSTVNQTFHQDFVKDIETEKIKTLWTLRNDDVFYFRWGAPDFVRDFIKNIPKNVTEGYYYGSDNYVWAKDFLTKNDSRGGLDITKHWYQWMCWGRLGYNPNLSNDHFINVIQSRFPSINANEMFAAWQSASMIYPQVTGFHWGALDFQWYIESGQSQPFSAKTPSGYHDINSFINLKPHPGTDNISIPDFVTAFLAKTEIKGTDPLKLANDILKNVDVALNWANKQSYDNSRELRFSIDDIKAMAYLGKYYAHKIKAATYIALFRETLQKEWHKKGIEELNLSAGCWRFYATIGLSNYNNPLWTNRVGHVDWKKNFQWALYEVLANGGKLDLPPMSQTAGGTILEAEDACKDASKMQTKVKGFTGKGYVGNGEAHAKEAFNWKFNATEAGEFVLEFRYTLNRDDVSPFQLDINGKKVCDIELWSVGNSGTWAWERVTVQLEQGVNTIDIAPERFVLLDHLNVLKVKK
jgi:hypothetical protein